MATPLLILLAVGGIAILLFLVIVVRMQAFIALLLTSVLVALLGGVEMAEIAGQIQDGMGSTLGYIAIVVGLGAMFGEMLQVSGGATRIARSLLRRFGEERAPWGLALTGVIVATPVFFDVALILFIPLVYSIVQRTGKSLLLYGVPLVGGIAVAHAFIPPTPGPVAVAGLLGADLGWVIVMGLVAGVPAAAIGGVLAGRRMATIGTQRGNGDLGQQAQGKSGDALGKSPLGAVTVSRLETHLPPVRPMTFGIDRGGPSLAAAEAHQPGPESGKPSFAAIAQQVKQALDHAQTSNDPRLPHSQGDTQSTTQNTRFASPMRVVELSLQPASLGALAVPLRLSGTGIRISFAATNRDTAEMLRSDRAALTDLVRGAGYDVDTVTIAYSPTTLTPHKST